MALRCRAANKGGTLGEALAHYDFEIEQIRECDQAISRILSDLPTLSQAEAPKPVKPLCNRQRTRVEQTALHQALYAVLGADLTAVPTLGIETVLVIASEIGPDLSRFPSSGHFCSWLSLAPPTRISGGKPLLGKTPKVLNRAGQLARLIYAMLTQGQPYVEQGIEAFETRRQARQLRALQRKAARFGLGSPRGYQDRGRRTGQNRGVQT